LDSIGSRPSRGVTCNQLRGMGTEPRLLWADGGDGAREYAVPARHHQGLHLLAQALAFTCHE